MTEILAPRFRKENVLIAELLKEARDVAPDATLDEKWLHSPPELRPWIESGHEADLARALRKLPILLWHPLVREAVVQQKQAVFVSELGTERDLQHRIRTLLGSWLEGWLPGWTLQKPTQRGRPEDLRTQHDSYEVTFAYIKVLDHLKQRENPRQSGERDDAWRLRLIGIARSAWDAMLELKLLLLQRRELPDDVVEQIVRAIPGKAPKPPKPTDKDPHRSLREHIVHELLAHGYQLTRNQVRRCINLRRADILKAPEMRKYRERPRGRA